MLSHNIYSANFTHYNKEEIKWTQLIFKFKCQAPSTGPYTRDEFVAKVKDYANKLANTISQPVPTYQETCMSREEQEAYVSETLNRALDQMEAHKRNGTKPMSVEELLRQLEEEEA